METVGTQDQETRTVAAVLTQYMFWSNYGDGGDSNNGGGENMKTS